MKRDSRAVSSMATRERGVSLEGFPNLSVSKSGLRAVRERAMPGFIFQGNSLPARHKGRGPPVFAWGRLAYAATVRAGPRVSISMSISFICGVNAIPRPGLSSGLADPCARGARARGDGDEIGRDGQRYTDSAIILPGELAGDGQRCMSKPILPPIWLGLNAHGDAAPPRTAGRTLRRASGASGAPRPFGSTLS